MAKAKYDLILYVQLTNPVVRFVRVADGMIWDNVAGALAAAPTYADTAISLTLSTAIGGCPVTIPAALPEGDYDMLFYDAASPAYTDAVSVGKRIMWNGTGLIGLPMDL